METELRDLKAQQDGRIENMFVWSNGVEYQYEAYFNDGKLNTSLTQKQYEFYKKFMTSKPHCMSNNTVNGFKMVEFWAYKDFNNGLPKWFNFLFN